MAAHPSRLLPTVGGKCLVVSAAGAGAGVLYLVDPNTTRVPLCPFHAMTGLWCPFCGSTRAAHALLHLQVGTALRDNAVFLAAVPFAMVFAGAWLTGLRLPPTRTSVRCLIVVVLIGFGVLRNLSIGSWLAPHA